MRPACVLLGAWLGACTSAPAHEPAHDVAHALVAAAVPQIARPAVVVRVLIGGDVIPHRPQLLDPTSVAAALTPLAQLFRSGDAAIVNYETATSDRPNLARGPLSMVATPAWMSAVLSANVTSLTLANNHACDLGSRGLAASINAARTLNVVALGADENDPWKPRTIASRDGRRACAVAWTTFVNDRRSPCADSRHLAVATPDRDGRARVARAITSAFREGCDAVVAIAHGGDEYAPQTAAMTSLARAAAEAGADAVVFHHPHVVSPLVMYETQDGRRVPIFASVGNLVSNQGESWTPSYPAAQRDRHVVYLNGWTRIGMIADLELRLDAKRTTFGFHLVFVESDHVLDKSNPRPRISARLLDGATDRTIIDKLSRDAAGPRPIFEDACWIDRGGTANGATAPSCR
jgi:poly-gamma-glutamate synthesis protein (capsule biosynthesis protein)